MCIVGDSQVMCVCMLTRSCTCGMCHVFSKLVAMSYTKAKNHRFTCLLVVICCLPAQALVHISTRNLDRSVLTATHTHTQRRIRLAIRLIQESARAVMEIPSMIFFPLTTLLFFSVLAVFTVTVGLYIASAGEYDPVLGTYSYAAKFAFTVRRPIPCPSKYFTAPRTLHVRHLQVMHIMIS